jgi:hypothetical protein
MSGGREASAEETVWGARIRRESGDSEKEWGLATKEEREQRTIGVFGKTEISQSVEATAGRRTERVIRRFYA